MNLDRVRAVADAVLYEGYLLYPYRASSRKNQVRWQFGVLGPPGAAAAGVGEESGMATQCLLRSREPGAPGPASVTVRLRFLQLQVRAVERYDGRGGYQPVDELTVDGRRVLTWEEAVEHEVSLTYSADELRSGAERAVSVAGGQDVEPLTGRGTEAGRIVRRRWPLAARVGAGVTADAGLARLEVRVDNVAALAAPDKDQAIRSSLIGAHLLIEAAGARFLSIIDPPELAGDAARRCRQHRCWPVLAGSPSEPGAGTVVLASPIILYDYPEVAEQSPGTLFDATEIDEILTLRVMTMTEQEKAEARATDPRAGEIVDRCDQMSPAVLQRLHGVLRDPHAEQPTPWEDPAADNAVRPDADAVVVDGVRVGNGSLVRVHPKRRADAQDLFFAGRVARVTAVLRDVDGGTHVALVLVDDPAADLHDWYGRYFYFAPDEVEPLSAEEANALTATSRFATPREESRT